ncbi:MAG: ABC transporter ATP-binding protein [Ruminococcaceae bacterium]|nr:ABC transporter ATP-binding protein [Oscillospiraceae bacterium]
MIGGEKARDFKGSLAKLTRFLRPYWFRIILVILFAATSTVFTIAGPKILSEAINILYEGVLGKMTGSGQGIDFTGIGRVLLWLLGLYALSSILSYIQGFIMSGLAQHISYSLRRDISLKIKRLPLSYFDKTTHGEVLSRVTNDVDTVSQTLNQSLSQLVTSVATLVGALIMMLSISLVMTLSAVIVLPLSMLIIRLIIKRSQKYFRTQQTFLGHLNGHVEEMYSGHLVVKAFNGEARSIETFEELNDELYKSSWRSQFLSGIMMPLMGFVGNLGYVFVVLIGALQASRGTVLLGDIVAFIQYVRMFNQPITQLASVANVLQSTTAAAERVFEFLEETEEPDDLAETSSAEGITGQVSFEEVSFGYNPDQTVITSFSADVAPGQMVAIVGPTGAGKTTIVKLLMRFYDVRSGAIKIDGVDIRKFKRSELRGLFGMVLQDTWLFNGTISDNIRFSREEATDEEIQAAAQAASADHFIRTLPGSYDMVLNEEVSNISQGQKQLLTIARALLADPRILILDEATSSVDTRTEVLIQQAMARLMHGRTSFIIAHRLSTIRDADLILVMRDGDIIEQGTHTQLLAAKGFYSELYHSQFETGVSEDNGIK